jgi:hypothetical protein
MTADRRNAARPYFIRTRMACRTAPHESSIIFIDKNPPTGGPLVRQLAVFEQWKLTSSGRAIFFTLIFQWAIIVLERAMLVLVMGASSYQIR